MKKIKGFHPEVDAEICVKCKELKYITKGDFYNPKELGYKLLGDDLVFCCDECYTNLIEKNSQVFERR